jgi:hypothetical protein
VRKNALIARKQGFLQGYLTCEKAEKEDKYQTGLVPKTARKRAKNGVNSHMTKNYQKDHAEIVWSEAIPDLNISEVTG